MISKVGMVSMYGSKHGDKLRLFLFVCFERKTAISFN